MPSKENHHFVIVIIIAILAFDNIILKHCRGEPKNEQTRYDEG